MCHGCAVCQFLLSCCSSSDHAAGHETKEKGLTARQAALQEGEQQLHAEKARLAALEATLKVCSAQQTPVILTFGHPVACCVVMAVLSCCYGCCHAWMCFQQQLPASCPSSACSTDCRCMLFLMVAVLAIEHNKTCC